MPTQPHPKVLATFSHIQKLIFSFLILNIAFAVAVLFVKDSIDTELHNSLLVRGVIFIFVSMLLLFFHRRMTSGKRNAWMRLRIMSIIAPISIIIFLVATPGLTWWVDALQAIGALIYIVIAVLINQEHMHSHFPKTKK
jgi:hypothetical protein